MRLAKLLMRFLNFLLKKIRLWIKEKRLARFRRAPKLFIPTSTRWQIVIPFKGISVLLLLILIVSSIYLFLRSDILLVKELKIQKLQGWQNKSFTSEDEVKDVLLPFLARSILMISKDEVTKRVQGEFLAIKTVSVKKEVPDRMLVVYSERMPAAVIKAVKVFEEEYLEKNAQGEEIKKMQKKVQTESFFVDEEGLIFARKDGEFDLPEFVLADRQNVNLGDQISGKELSAALKIILTFNNNHELKINKVSLREEGEIEVIFTIGLTVLFEARNKDITFQTSSLQTIYQRSKIEGRRLSRVDLRFEKPVIK